MYVYSMYSTFFSHYGYSMYIHRISDVYWVHKKTGPSIELRVTVLDAALPSTLSGISRQVNFRLRYLIN